MIDLFVYAPGDTVTIGNGIEATINQVNIESVYHVSYKCSWFDGATRNEQWIQSHEIKINKLNQVKIGFIKGENND